MIRPGLASVSFRNLTPQNVAALAAASGLEAVEWGGDVHVPSVAAASEARKLSEDHSLITAAYGSYWRASGEFGPELEIALALGAPTIRVWAGQSGSASETSRSRVVLALRRACEMAWTAGVTVSLEYHSGTLTDTLPSTLSLLEEVAHPSLRLYWQPVPTRTLAERLEELSCCLPHLSNLHVFQWIDAPEHRVRQPLSEGAAEWPDCLAMANGDRWALIEFVPGDDPAILPREATTLRGWLKSL